MAPAALVVAVLAASPSARQAAPPDVRWFFEAAGRDDRQAREALARIAAAWHDGYTAMVVDLARLMQPARRSPAPETAEPGLLRDDEDGPPGLPAPRGIGGAPAAPPHPSSIVRARLTRFLETQTGERFGDDLRRWRQWMWSRPYEPHPEYAAFKGVVYGQIDPRMQEFFPPGVRAAIRLDEIDWGGVPVNGIPPLVYPTHVPAAEARYLRDRHVVFGLVVNGEPRAYPQRILAWHEMARDRLGGVEITVAYCTLCGTVIPYESEAGGVHRTFGTSGLLYQSNKLMFDEESKSLWSTFEGVPVVGPLVGSGVRLRALPVVTTTWREWRAQHPQTTVLSLDTGHDRNYAEGAAYREYFATDRLMFEVSRTDNRLRNKAEVVVMLLSPAEPGGVRVPVAFSADFLRRHPVYHAEFAGRRLVVVTSPDGANRVYDAGRERFVKRSGADRVSDAPGRTWRVTESALVEEGGTGRRPRLPAQRAFWFGWYAQFPETELVR